MQPQYEAERDVKHNINCVYRSLDNVHPHFHQSIEITCMLEGELNFKIGSREYPLSDGQITFTPAYFPHSSSHSERKNRAVVLIVPKKYCEAFYSFYGNADFFYLDDVKKNKEIVRHIQALADGIETMDDFTRQAYVNMIFALIASNYSPAESSDKHIDFAVEIIRYLEENCTRQLTLESVSAHFGYSKYYFSRLFNKTFSCTLPSYLNALRVRCLESHQTQTDELDKSKSDLIYEAGFNTLSSYYRAKKK